MDVPVFAPFAQEKVIFSPAQEPFRHAIKSTSTCHAPASQTSKQFQHQEVFQPNILKHHQCRLRRQLESL